MLTARHCYTCIAREAIESYREQYVAGSIFSFFYGCDPL